MTGCEGDASWSEKRYTQFYGVDVSNEVYGHASTRLPLGPSETLL